MTNDLALLVFSTAIQMAGAIIFSVVLNHFARRDGRTYLRFWIWSWLAFVVYAAGAMVGRLLYTVPPTSALRVGLSVLTLGAGFLQVFWLLLGTREFVTRRLGRTYFAPTMAAAILVATALTLAWIDDPDGSRRYLARVGVRSVAVCLAFVSAALWLAFQDPSRGRVARFLLPVALTLYGIDQGLMFLAAAPMGVNLALVSGFRLSYGALDVFLQLLIGLGMALSMLERERDERLGVWQRMVENEERYRTLAESATDAIFTIDDDSRIVFVNSAVERTFGYTPAELTGRSITDLMPDWAAERHRSAVASYIRSGARKSSWGSMSLTGRNRSGAEVPLEMSLTENLLNGRRLFTGVVRDVSERRQMEEQLLQAQKLEAVGRLAGGIAHDFNNLLTAIGGYADTSLAELPEGHPARRAIVEIRSAAGRAADLTRNLLTFSRKQPIRTRRINLSDEVEEITAMLRRVIGEDIVLEVTRAPHPVYINADPRLIGQVLLNLVLNARDAMPQGGRLVIETVTLTLTAPAAAPPGRARPDAFACLIVRDSGLGIAPEHLPHIFEPFFTTKDVGKGTGLGLATSYGVVQQHGGWIEVDSAVDRGTTFRVFLPESQLSLEDAPADHVATASTNGHETILLVEDEAPVRALIKHELVTRGYTVLEASNGPSALTAAERHGARVDLLLTDIVMPGGMTGIDLASTLRRGDPTLRVVLMSGYYADDAVKEVQAGTIFVPKPLSMSDVTRSVRRCLDAPS